MPCISSKHWGWSCIAIGVGCLRFFTHLNKGEHMLLSEFVRFTNWIFTHYTSEEVRLKVWMGIGTVLFCHTKENADYGWHPFGLLPKELACW